MEKCNSIQCSFIEITTRESETRIGIKTFSFLYDIFINFNLNGKTFFLHSLMHSVRFLF